MCGRVCWQSRVVVIYYDCQDILAFNRLKCIVHCVSEKTWCLTFCAKFYGKKCYIYFIDNLLLFPTAKEFSKSVNSWWRCHKKFDATFFFWDDIYCIMWGDLSALNGCFMLLSDICLFLEGLEGKWEHWDCAYLCQGESGSDLKFRSQCLPKFNGDFCVQGYIYGELFVKMR